MFSIYFSAFNLIKNKFPFGTNVGKACDFADEVVIAVNKSEDDTLLFLTAMAIEYPKIKIVETNFSYDDIRFDGAIKNAALQATTQPVKIQMDLDEYIPLSQKKRWEYWGNKLLDAPHVQCFMIPSIDLYGAKDSIKAGADIGLKFRMHKAGLHRGIMKDAWVGSHILTNRSDTTELIDDHGQIPHCMRIAPAEFHNSILAFGLQDYPYTIHEGYLSFEHRVNINKAVWAKAWRDRSGHDEDTPTEIRQLAHVPTTKHGLPLE